MSIQSEIANRRLNRIGPLGTVLGLLTASMVSVVGLIVELDPLVILTRATISAFLVGTTVRFGLNVLQAANIRNE